MLAQLSQGEATVGELAEPYDMSMAAVSKHLKVLEHAGLILRGREAQYRPCRLDAAPMKEAAEYLGEFRRFWQRSFNRLDVLLDELQSEETKENRSDET